MDADRSTKAIVDDLLDELDEHGVLPLHQLTWAQDIGRRPDDTVVILQVAETVYAELRRRRPEAWRGWIRWPDLSPDAAEPVDPDVPPDFLLDHTTGTPDGRLQVLVLDRSTR